MSRLATLDLLLPRREELSSRHLFAAATVTLATGEAFLAGCGPLGFSIVTVFLFAGPHNWIELRYFMARMPGRWGRLRGYFLLSFAGILGLTASFAVLPWLAQTGPWRMRFGGQRLPSGTAHCCSGSSLSSSFAANSGRAATGSGRCLSPVCCSQPPG